MTTEKIILRHTISKQAYSYDAEYARDLLADPGLGQYLEEVKTEKPEVLGSERKAHKGSKDEAATALTEEQIALLSAGETVTTKADVVAPSDKDKD
jgi:hypothetical protein